QTPPTELYTLSLHDALPILPQRQRVPVQPPARVHRSVREARVLLRAQDIGTHLAHDHSAARRPEVESGDVPDSALRHAASRASQDRKSTRLNSSHVKISYAV